MKHRWRGSETAIVTADADWQDGTVIRPTGRSGGMAEPELVHRLLSSAATAKHTPAWDPYAWLEAAKEIARLRLQNAVMLEALKALRLQALQSNVNSPANEWGQEALAMANAAIAAATGETGEGNG